MKTMIFLKIVRHLNEKIIAENVCFVKVQKKMFWQMVRERNIVVGIN